MEEGGEGEGEGEEEEVVGVEKEEGQRGGVNGSRQGDREEKK